MLDNFSSSEYIYSDFLFNFLFSLFKLQINIYTVFSSTLIDSLNTFLFFKTLLSVCMTFINNLNLICYFLKYFKAFDF